MVDTSPEHGPPPEQKMMLKKYVFETRLVVVGENNIKDKKSRTCIFISRQ
jgi:hypothetical protein